MIACIATLNRIKDILEKSPRIIAFCIAQDWGPLNVIYPADNEDPASVDQAPWIVLDPESGRGGLAAESCEYSIGLDLGLDVTDASKGVQLLGEFYGLALDVLVRAGIPAASVDYSFVCDDAAPLRMIFSSITINDTRPIGRGSVI